MKKTRIIAAATALTTLIAVNSIPFSANAFQLVTNNAQTEFDSKQTAYVMISFEYDHDIVDKALAAATEKAKQIADEFLEGVDENNYQEKFEGEHFGITIHFNPEHPALDHKKALYAYSETYRTVIRNNLWDETMEELKKQFGNELLAEIGAEPTENTIYPHYGTVISEINSEQLEKAKNNERISIISVDDDWSGEFDGRYIGTPQPAYVNTACAEVAQTNNTETTAAALQGDANCDGKTTVADSVAVLQHIANRDKYGLKAQGLLNADVDGEAGITANDARVLQEWDANS